MRGVNPKPSRTRIDLQLYLNNIYGRDNYARSNAMIYPPIGEWMRQVADRVAEMDYGRFVNVSNNSRYHVLIQMFIYVFGDNINAYTAFAALKGNHQFDKEMRNAADLQSYKAQFVSMLVLFKNVVNIQVESDWNKILEVMNVIYVAEIEVDVDVMYEIREVVALYDKYGAESLKAVAQLLKVGLSCDDIRVGFDNGIDPEMMIAAVRQ